MKRSMFIRLLMEYKPEEDIEVVFIGDGTGSVVVDDFGYHEVYPEDIDRVVDSNGEIVGVALNTY